MSVITQDKFSFMFLHTCRKAKFLLPQVEVEHPLIADDQSEDYQVQVEDRMMKMAAVREKMFTEVSDNIRDAQARYKKDYDKKRCQAEVTVDSHSPCKVILYFTLPQEMNVGSSVLLRNSKRDTKKGDKMQPKWLGPYVIVSSLGKGVYQIKNQSTDLVLKKAVHSARLKQYFTQEHTSLPQAIQADDAHRHEVEQMVSQLLVTKNVLTVINTHYGTTCIYLYVGER